MKPLVPALLLCAACAFAQAPKKAEPVRPDAPAPASAPAPAPAPAAQPEMMEKSRALPTPPKPAPVEALVGNKGSKTLHKPDCKSLAKLKPENRVTFATKEEATKKGYKACKTCKP